jgi:trigger factor
MRATAESMEDNKVKLTVEVDETELDKALDEVVKEISRSARIPGFRPGKAPRRVLEARMGGAGALRSEALRESLPSFYARAIVDTDIDPISSPEIDITAGEESGPVSFEAIVEIRPTVSIPGYAGLVATVPAIDVAESDIDAQVDRLRENDGELTEVARPIAAKDVVTIDLVGKDAEGNVVADVSDYLYEVGSGTIVEELDESLRGLKAGETVSVTSKMPDETAVTFDVKISTVQEKILPELTDEWAAEASEFTTVEALRNDIADRLSRMKIMQAQFTLRESALGALAGLVDDQEVPEVLVDAEVNERLHDLGHRLENQKLTIEQFLTATNQSGEDLVASLRGESAQAVKIDLALRAVAAAENLSVSSEELDEEIAKLAEQFSTTPRRLREQLDENGRTVAVRAEIAKNKASTWLLEHVEVVDEEGKSIDRELLKRNAGDEEES